MIILLVIPLLFGYFIATRILREKEMLSVAVLSASLGIAGILFFVNPLVYFFPLHACMYITLALMGIISLILWRIPAGHLVFEPPPRNHVIILSAGTLVILLFTIYLQVIRPDDDYWIHTPLMGLFLKGQFPPVHPFFPYIELPGHYGRDLSISAISVLARDNFTTMCWVITAVIQPLIFLLCYLWVRTMTRSSLQGLYCALFVFFGVNVGSRSGLFDIIQNNNSFVYLYFFLIIHVFFKVLQGYRLSSIVLCIALLGLYPVVYESHYGLLVLSFITISLYIFFREKRHYRPLLVCMLIIALTVPIALLEGGLFTSKLKSQAKAATMETMYEKSNTQKVSITFPKHELFQIYLGPGQYQRVSLVFPILFPWVDYEALSSDYRYAFVWSPSFLLLVWFPFYLAPFTVVYLFRKGNIPGLFLWIFGCISFLVPAMVNFGPVFEEEYFRWEGAAGIGFAGAMGICIACIITWLGTLAEKKDLILKRKIAWGFLSLFIALNFIGALSYFNNMLVEYERKAMKRPNRVSVSFHGLPDPLSLITAMGIGIHSVDIRTCAWLRAHTCKRDTVLRNFEEKIPPDLMAESTIAGLAGVNMLGHTFPPFKTELRSSPFRMNLRARAFWNTADSRLLKDMSVHWVYVDINRLAPPVYEKLLNDKNLRLLYRDTDESGQKRAVFEYIQWDRSLPQPCSTIPEDIPEQQDAWISGYDLPAEIYTCHFYPANVTIRNEGSKPLAMKGNVTYTWSSTAPGAVSNIFDRIEMPNALLIPPGKACEIPLYLVTPYSPGTYRLSLFLRTGERVFRLRDSAQQRIIEIEKSREEEHK